MPTFDDTALNYVTPIAPILPSVTPSAMATRPITTDPNEFYRHLSPIKTFPKFLKPPPPMFNDIPKYSAENQRKPQAENITVFTMEDPESPFKIIHPDPSLSGNNNNWQPENKKSNDFVLTPINIPPSVSYPKSRPSQKYNDFVLSDHQMHDMIQHFRIIPPDVRTVPPSSNVIITKPSYEPVRKIPTSKVDHFNYFLPTYDRKPSTNSFLLKEPSPDPETKTSPAPLSTVTFFEPLQINSTAQKPKEVVPNPYHVVRDHSLHGSRGKHVTILRTKDLTVKNQRPNDNTVMWVQDAKTHVLTKAPNPYETVLLRPIPNAMTQVASKNTLNSKIPRIAEKTYSALDLEHLLTQMEVESEVNRNLGRSADKIPDASGQR